MIVFFALLPRAADLDQLLASEPELRDAWSRLRCRRYPAATDAAHLLSLVRAGRDRGAVRWLRGLALAIGGGAVLGASTNGILAGAFGMLGGMLELAIPLGLLLGAFLGGFTALMTGTEVAREEVRRLAQHVQSGDVLLQLQVDDREQLRRLGEWCAQHGLRWVHVEP